LGFFDERQELGMFAHTIFKNAWKVWNFAVPLHRQSEIKLMTRITFKENKRLRKG
jgi:hypothetical protein